MPVAVVNPWAVLGAAVASMVVGMLWYSPALFGKKWMKLMGFTEESMKAMQKKGMALQYGVSFVAALVMGYVLARMVYYLGAFDVVSALLAAFWLWLGFQATTLVNGVLWGGKPWTLYLIDAAHHLVSLALMAVILVSWV